MSGKEIKPSNNLIDISDLWNTNNNYVLNFIDLFCGAGGLGKGLDLINFFGVTANDIDKDAVDTYNANFKHKAILGSVEEEEVKNKIIDELNNSGKILDLITGGFPCQGFSLAGLRDINDSRNKLYLQLKDIVEKTQPKFIFMENVTGILSMNKGLVIEKIIKDFRSIGYNIDYRVLNSADFDVPQSRKRVIFIANNIGIENLFPEKITQIEKTVKDAIDDLKLVENNKIDSHILTRHRPEMVDRISKLSSGKSLYENFSDSWRRLYSDRPSFTIKENHGATHIHYELNRVITPREMARLQSFSDDFIFKGPKSKRLKQLGNAVPPLLAKAVGLAIVKMYKKYIEENSQ